MPQQEPATELDPQFSFLGDGGRALVFEVRPRKAFGFAKLDTFSQTRWRFGS